MEKRQNLTVKTVVKATVDKVWKFWTNEEHIKNWNNASEEWHTPKVANDLTQGGRFVYRMEAKDGSFGFDLGGFYDVIDVKKHITYTLDDGRRVQIDFSLKNDGVRITECFEAETENSLELQEKGWQAILDNFKRYTEAN